MASNIITYLAQLEKEGKHLLLLIARGLLVPQSILVTLLHMLPLNKKHIGPSTQSDMYTVTILMVQDGTY